DDTGGVPGVHARLLDVLHDPADHEVARRIADGVDVDLDGVLEKPIDEYGPFGREPALPAQGAEPGELGHGPAQALLVVDDLHGPAAEHVAGAHQRRVADPVDHGQGVVDGDCDAARRLGDLEASAQRIP